MKFYLSDSCKAEWHTSDWGSCSSNCGTGGVQVSFLPYYFHGDFYSKSAIHSFSFASFPVSGQPQRLRRVATVKAVALQQLARAHTGTPCHLVAPRLFLFSKVSSLPCPLPPLNCMFFALSVMLFPHLDESCEDNSRYCDIIKVFHS